MTAESAQPRTLVQFFRGSEDYATLVRDLTAILQSLYLVTSAVLKNNSYAIIALLEVATTV